MKIFAALGAIYGLIAVGAGAFGAHGLKAHRPAELMPVFETGARYQMYHALALLLVAVLGGQMASQQGGLRVAGWAMALGSIVFSGSLYALVLTENRTWGAVTPIGGLALLVGWVMLAISIVRS